MTKVTNMAIIGSHKVGKTTLYEKVVEELPPEYKIKCLDELAIEKISEATTFFSYMAIQEDILAHQIKVLDWVKENEVSTFSDRSLIDNFAYMMVGKYSPYPYAISGDLKSSREILKVLSPIVSQAIEHFYDYDLLFYIPIEFKLGSPSEEQIMYQWMIDDAIKHLLKIYGIKHFTIKGSKEDRKILTLARIKQYMEDE